MTYSCLLRWFSRVVLLLLLLSHTACLVAQQTLPLTTPVRSEQDTFVEAETPAVSRIIMYNSGLSQFIHEGNVTNNQRVSLDFSLHDIDDVLKSLVFEDQGGGIVRAVEYKPAPDNQDVAAEKLGPAMTLAQTLQKYRGEAVTIKTTKGDEIQGNVLSVENRQMGGDFVETLTITNQEGFISIPVNDFSSIQFEDEELRKEFQLAMAGLSKSRVADAKRIELLFEGENARDVAFSYNVDAPIWRMTYRLNLEKGVSTMQGWAHIDNVTGVDWKEIELDLRSGRPQSFHVDLFAPVLAERGSLGLGIFDIPTDKALVPQYFGFDPPPRLSGEDDYEGLGGGTFGGNSFGAGGGMGGMGGGDQSRPNSGMDITSAFRGAAASARSNKMVRFKIKDPVTLAAGRSAMVPVLSEKPPVKLYSMFTVPSKNAELIASIENNSALPLIPGPVTIYSQGDFLGDGVLQRIEVGAISELVYGADLSVSLQKKDLPVVFEVSRVSLDESGRVEVVNTLKSETRYTMVNEDSLPRDFLLRVPVTKPVFSPKPARREGRLAIYELTCNAKGSVELVFSETATKNSTLLKKNVSEELVDEWKKKGVVLGPAFTELMLGIFETKRQFLQRDKRLKEVLVECQNEFQRLTADSLKSQKNLGDAQEIQNQIKADQTRLINIVKLLTPESERAKPYLEKLTASEAQFEKVSEQVGRLMEDANRVLRLAEDAKSKCEEAEAAVQQNQKEYDDTVQGYDKEAKPLGSGAPF